MRIRQSWDCLSALYRHNLAIKVSHNEPVALCSTEVDYQYSYKSIAKSIESHLVASTL
jgi:hypothetical protein